MEIEKMERDHIPNIKAALYLPYLDVRILREKIDEGVRMLTPHLGEFDAIAFRGVSGALLAPPLALRLNKSLIVVRKMEESNHSGREVEGDRAARSYIIVDDMVATGATLRAIKEGVKGFAPQARYRGTLLFFGGVSWYIKHPWYEENVAGMGKFGGDDGTV